MEIIKFTETICDGSIYVYGGITYGENDRRIKGLEVIYTSKECDRVYRSLRSSGVDYTFYKFYIPYLNSYRTYEKADSQKTKFAKFLDTCEYGTKIELDCIIDITNGEWSDERIERIFGFKELK